MKLLAAAALLILVGEVKAQTCPQLCGTPDKTIALAKCVDQTKSSVPYSPCCDNGNGQANCPDTRKCRSVEFSTSVGCPQQPGEVDECLPPGGQGMEMKLLLSFEQSLGGCCAQCTCAGDPHCYAFNGAFDDWIICDGRAEKKGGGCDMTKATCEAVDYPPGTPCVWQKAPEGGEGFECVRNPATPVPEMLFFKKGNDEISFIVGDRGIINIINIKEGANLLSLSAIDCKDFPQDPWVGTPIGDLQSQKLGRLWIYPIASAKVTVRVTCVPSGTVEKSPHLDVTLVAQGVAPGEIPQGITGYCSKPDGKIDEKDPNIVAPVCQSKVKNEAKAFNNDKPVKNVQKFAKQFCKKYMAVGGKQDDYNKLVKTCTKNLLRKGGPGWATVFCAANLVTSKDPADCSASIDCATCVTDYKDYGAEYIIEKWDKTKPKGVKPGPQCVRIDQLPDDLIDCQRGIRIQYQEESGAWATLKAVPQGYTLCASSGVFNNEDFPQLFNSKVRVTECDLNIPPPGIICPDEETQKCDKNDGYTVTVETKVLPPTVSPFDITKLVDEKKLICNPSMYPPGSEECFKTPFDVCPTCIRKTGVYDCRPAKYGEPCGPPNNDHCKTCINPLVP